MFTFTIKHEARDNGPDYYTVRRNGRIFSPYFSNEADAAMFLHRVKYDRGHDAVACIMLDSSYKQAHGVTATLPTFAQPDSDWCVTYAVKKRINNADRDDMSAVY